MVRDAHPSCLPDLVSHLLLLSARFSKSSAAVEVGSGLEKVLKFGGKGQGGERFGTGRSLCVLLFGSRVGKWWSMQE